VHLFEVLAQSQRAQVVVLEEDVEGRVVHQQGEQLLLLAEALLGLLAPRDVLDQCNVVRWRCLGGVFDRFDVHAEVDAPSVPRRVKGAQADQVEVEDGLVRHRLALAQPCQRVCRNTGIVEEVESADALHVFHAEQLEAFLVGLYQSSLAVVDFDPDWRQIEDRRGNPSGILLTLARWHGTTTISQLVRECRIYARRPGASWPLRATYSRYPPP
jgi:hypothetical protein